MPQYSLLAIDTAFDLCSVALVTPDCSDIRVGRQLRKHADDVLPMVDSLLSAQHLKIRSLTALAMVSGPGSFTGLRIGTAVVQGLAFGANLPVLCVSSLAMIARAARRISDSERLILTCLHAREDEFYFAVYRDNLDDSPQSIIADALCNQQQVEQTLADFRASSKQAGLILAGSGWQHERLAAAIRNSNCQIVTVAVDALLLAELAAQDLRAGRAVDAADARPAYLNDVEYRTV